MKTTYTLRVLLNSTRAFAKCNHPGAFRNTTDRFRGCRHTAARIPTAPGQKVHAAQIRKLSSIANKKAKNRIYDPVHRPDELTTYILSSTSSRNPLITFWTVSWCVSCDIVKPLLHSLISSGVGEPEGGVAFCELVLDSQDLMDSELGMQYMITSMPTLLTFDRGEAIPESRTVDVARLKDKKWLKEWIEGEAKRRGHGTGGAGGLGSGLFGGLFGDRR